MKDGWKVLIAMAAVALCGGVRLARDALDARRDRLAQPDEYFQSVYCEAPDGSLYLRTAMVADADPGLARRGK